MKKFPIFLGLLLVALGINLAVQKIVPQKQTIQNIYPQYNLAQLIKEADLIVLGTVQEKRPSQLVKVYQGDEIAGEEIYTDYLFEVENNYKNNLNSQEILIRLPGGQVGNKIVELADGDIKLEVGQKALVFLKKIEGNTYALLGGPQGKFLIENNQALNQGGLRDMPLQELLLTIEKNK